MFYYPTVLKRHTGCFSTIWLVATKGIKVPRREFLKVNVKRTCDEIMNYVLERVPPPRPDLPRPRFSLYLSSQLQYGVVLVYHRQCAILLEELQSILSHLLKQRNTKVIDLDDGNRQTMALPDGLSLMAETENAPDPLFGVMDGLMHSPTTLLQMSREYTREVSPELPELPDLTSPAAPVALELQGITASPEAITLRETEPVAIPAAEFEGVDLADHLPDIIDFLLDQKGHFPEEGVELPEGAIPQEEEERELKREGRDSERQKMKELTGSTAELQSTTVPGEDAALLPLEAPGPRAETPKAPRDEVTLVSGPLLPSPPSAARKKRPRTPELEDVHPEVSRRRRRRRQLVFFDPETQLPQNEQQQQIDDPLTETRPLALPLLFSQRTVPASELFSNPCIFLPDEIRSLWRQAATITPLPGSDLQVGAGGPESSDSERERETMEAAEREEQRLDQVSSEVPMVEPEMFDISAGGTLPLEASDQRELSREISPIYTSDREGSIIFKSALMLQDIPERESETADREAAAESPGWLPELVEHEGESVLFRSLLPPEANRKTVSNLFQKLLEKLSSGRIRAEQHEPFGDILIFPGSSPKDLD
ncbi:meiotic recombination protein REC8 homolog isoform X2 [Nothobranchius furzeri]|uniref:Meiotic recombination protein REC8-like protein n=1 Tax=Nothobranchius furzeri TaxID=105023 RepID=A0A9D2YW07_NOTFU|nr:meiotic recombination protein REC8-like protein [Nothobranchius furzeri]